MTRSEIMSRIKGRDTRPEVGFRRRLRESGLLGYRIQWGKHRIDVAWPGRKVAIFIDGCFWHMCPEHFRMPKSRIGYWEPKLKANQRRDRIITQKLEDEGWAVFRVWEHEWEDYDLSRIGRALS